VKFPVAAIARDRAAFWAGCRARIIYHLLTDGVAWAEVEGAPRVDLKAGDIVVFPHGDPHLMGNGQAVDRWITGRN
jgi:hypothetical protein